MSVDPRFDSFGPSGQDATSPVEEARRAAATVVGPEEVD